MKLIKYAQSTVRIDENRSSLLIDLGNYNFEPGRLSREKLDPVNVLVITHKHADHFDLDAIKALWSSCRPTIITNLEIAGLLRDEGIDSIPLQENETVSADRYKITATHAEHVVRDEVVSTIGVLVEINGKRIYHTSDTTYHELTPDGIDVLFLPINNRGVAMGFDDAVRFAVRVRPAVAVPVHFDSPKDAHINPDEWAQLSSSNGVNAQVMRYGDQLTL